MWRLLPASPPLCSWFRTHHEVGIRPIGPERGSILEQDGTKRAEGWRSSCVGTPVDREGLPRGRVFLYTNNHGQTIEKNCTQKIERPSGWNQVRRNDSVALRAGHGCGHRCLGRSE